MRLLAALTLFLSLAGCVRRLPPPVPAHAPLPSADAAYQAWGRVLAANVDGRGRIDFDRVTREPADLHAYVAWAAANGPRSTPAAFPSKEDALAYHLNTYNALAMFNAVTNDVRPVDKIRFFFLTTLAIDGAPMSLYAYENDVIRPFGEPRIHFALNCMVRGCPRLPQEPYRAASLEKQLEEGAVLFLNEERNVQVDDGRKTVRLSSILKFYTEDFLAAEPSLIAYANRYRERKIPGDYRVEFIPYDWTLNRP